MHVGAAQLRKWGHDRAWLAMHRCKIATTVILSTYISNLDYA